MRRKWLIYVFILLVLFWGIGYFLSDAFYFRQVIKKHSIESPATAFTYIKKETRPINFEKFANIVPGLSPKYLLTKRKYLWCDEGAIVMLTFADQLGYQTRLTDFLDSAGISHHTVAQVYENNRWITYDYTFDHTGAVCDEKELGYAPQLRYRNYPNLYNTLSQNNYFLKQGAFLLRGIKEPDVPEFGDGYAK